MFVDTHAHLFFKDFEDDLAKVLQRAKDAGIGYVVCPGTDIETSRQSIELAEKYENVYAAVGIHPHDAKKAASEDGKMLDFVFAEIEELSKHPKVVAVGEIGLDYHYNFSPSDIQQEVFSRQISIARQRNLPIIIHMRKAEDDTLRIVHDHVLQDTEWRRGAESKKVRQQLPKGVFHCFPGDSTMARKIIEWGFYISFPGPVTFPVKPNKPNAMVEVAEQIPLEHILLETDSPYLTPYPFRGKRNEPAHMTIIAKKVAELKGCSFEEVARLTTAGAVRLFRLGNLMNTN